MANFEWGYSNNNGPHIWAAHYSSAQGSHQSPVNLCSKHTRYEAQLKNSPLHLNYSENIANAHICNTGSSVKVNCKDEISTLSGGPLAPGNNYRPLQFHLHWGSDDRWGSEHVIEGQPTAAELHIVHWNNTLFKTVDEAVDDNQQRGLCVLGVFLKIGEHNHSLDSFISQIEKIDTCGKHHNLDNLNLRSLLPENIENYWTYSGSLTTPPCSECVTWILFKDVCEISKEQMKSLRSLHTAGCHSSDYIQDNFRPPVPLGNRTLRSSFPLEKCDD